MDEFKDKKYEEPEKQELIIDTDTRSDTVASKKVTKKKNGAFKYVAFFLAGALTFAIITGLYRFMNGDFESVSDTERTQIILEQKRIAQEQLGQYIDNQTKPTEITADELANYVESKDCTLDNAYSSLEMASLAREVTWINLYDGIATRSANSSSTATWQTLPSVVDYNCTEIPISDIKIGDRVTLYQSSEPGAKSGIMLIQKLNK